MKMMRSVLVLCFVRSIFINPSSAMDDNNLQDTCPTAAPSDEKESIFFNGFPCKNPATISPSDFKSSSLKQAGDTDNFLGSATTVVGAAEFPGLNTLGLSVARTDLDVDGVVLPHTHPRATEMFFVRSGIVVAGFVDTKNQLFQRILREGDIFVFPKGLLHYCLNAGFENAVVFSVLNSQNPGLVSIADTMFAARESKGREMMARRLVSLSKLEVGRIGNVTLFEF